MVKVRSKLLSEFERLRSAEITMSSNTLKVIEMDIFELSSDDSCYHKSNRFGCRKIHEQIKKLSSTLFGA